MPASVAASRPQRSTSVTRNASALETQTLLQVEFGLQGDLPGLLGDAALAAGEVHHRFVDAGDRDIDAEIAQLRADAWPFAEKMRRGREIIGRQRGQDEEIAGTRPKRLKPARRALPELASRLGLPGMAPRRLLATRQRQAPQTQLAERSRSSPPLHGPASRSSIPRLLRRFEAPQAIDSTALR